jgi:L-lactate dehydrogenase complex protein LldG
VDIDLPRLLLRVRAGLTEENKAGEPAAKPLKPNPPAWLATGLRLFTLAAERPGRFRLAQKLIGSVLGGKGWIRLPVWSGWGFSKDFPRPARRSFQQQWAAKEASRSGEGALVASEPKPVAIPLGEQAAQPAVIRAELNQKTLVDQLRGELEVLGGRFIICNSEEIAGKVIELLQEKNYRDILAWEARQLPDGLLEKLQDAGIRVVHPAAEDKVESGQVAIGLTGAIGAAAETGSLAIPGGAGRPLAASLLPEVHIAVLRMQDVVAGLDDLLKLPALSQPAAAALVSGPSRTADIEMTLTIGVHGPGELIVLCYGD